MLLVKNRLTLNVVASSREQPDRLGIFCEIVQAIQDGMGHALAVDHADLEGIFRTQASRWLWQATVSSLLVEVFGATEEEVSNVWEPGWEDLLEELWKR